LGINKDFVTGIEEEDEDLDECEPGLDLDECLFELESFGNFELGLTLFDELLVLLEALVTEADDDGGREEEEEDEDDTFLLKFEDG
jgi:hypothetical protein